MSANGVRLTLERVQAMSYQARSGKGRLRRTNFIVELRGTTEEGAQLVGLGEGQPRDEATGDRLEASWDLLEAALRQIAQISLSVATSDDVLPTVRSVMAELEPLVTEHGPETARLMPFRGTLFGVETALLDITCRAVGVPLVTVLGAHRKSAPTYPKLITTSAASTTLSDQVKEQAVQSPAVRLRGRSSVEATLDLLESAAASMAETAAADIPLWVDMERRLDRGRATELVRSVVAGINEGRLPHRIIIERPAVHRDLDLDAVLQRFADRAIARSRVPDADVQIMTDQSLWQPATLGRRARLRRRLARLVGTRPPRAVHLRPSEVGGTVATLELADAMYRSISDAHARHGVSLYLGSEPGATTITGGLTRNLAMAMPRLDGVVDYTLAAEPTVDAPTEPGIGAAMDYERTLRGAEQLVSVPPPVAPSHHGLSMNVYDDVDVIRPLGLNFTKGFLLEREALARGLATRRFTRSTFMASDGKHEALTFKKSRTPLSSAVAMALCTHKEATRIWLKRAGVPVPNGMTFAQGDYAAARAFIERIGYPVVVKPAMGVSGVGVAANIADDEALQHAFDQLAATRFGSGDFIVEQHVRGHDHRIVVVGDEVVGAILRDPASVDGDGQRTVAELIIAKNIARRANPHLWGRPIKYGEAAHYHLERAGLSLDSVPGLGQKVALSNSGNLALGADSVDVLDEMHPSIKETCIRAVRAIPGLRYCGLDFLLEDHTKPVDEQQAAICELNAHAAIGNCEYPIYGASRDAAGRIIDECIARFDLDADSVRADRLAIKVTVRGDVAGTATWLRRRARSTGISGWSQKVDERTVEAVLVGDLQPVSALAAAAITGPRAAGATEVITEHLEAEPAVSGFEVLNRPPETA